MAEDKKEDFKAQVVSWLQNQKVSFENYLNDVRQNKLKCLSPKVQGQVMASAGVIAFINSQLEYLEKGDIQ